MQQHSCAPSLALHPRLSMLQCRAAASREQHTTTWEPDGSKEDARRAGARALRKRIRASSAETRLSCGRMQVFFKVIMGYRPPVPEGMPEGYRDLMTASWHEDPAQRPPFEDVERFLRTLYYAASAGDDAAPRNSRRSLELNPWG